MKEVEVIKPKKNKFDRALGKELFRIGEIDELPFEQINIL